MIGAALVMTVLAAPPAQSVAVDVAMEPELTTTVGYTRRVHADGSLTVAFGGGLKLAPALLLATHGLRVQGIGAARWTAANGLGAELTLLPYFVHDAGLASTANGFGVEARVVPGFFGARGAIGVDLGYQATLVTHLAHTALVDDSYGDRYPDGVTGGVSGPRDGWYGVTAQRLRLGLTGAWRFTEAFGARLSLGMLRSVQQQGIVFGFNLGQVPVYAELGATVRW